MLGTIKTETEIPEPTKVPAGYIKAIGNDTVHKICSGQVVLSLAVAVKELVENALDAGSTLVEVKLHEYGMESVEVSDNGSGVPEHDIEAMTTKHHTSKLRDFVDLQGVETFGFRGEALSALCALSDVVIVTRHKSSDVGIKVELDHCGNIMQSTPCARSMGTTVTLSELFATLPVRKRDFMRNIKKEFARMCQMLQAYGLVSKGVRIICTNQSIRGIKTVVLQTHGSGDVRANIVAIFGCKQSTDVVTLKSPYEEGILTTQSLFAKLQDEDGEWLQLTNDDVQRLNEQQYQFEGYLSSCAHGSGRSSKDRQYFYINSRPCDHKQMAKLVNNMYRRYNVQQFPFVFLNVFTDRNDIDVNLSKDKRQLLVHNEKILLIAIKNALLNTYGHIASTFKLQNSSILSMLPVESKTKEETETKEGDKKRDIDKMPLMSMTQLRRTGESLGVAPHQPAAKRKCVEEVKACAMALKKMQAYLSEGYGDETVHVLSGSESESEQHVEKTQPDFVDKSTLNVKALSKESQDFDKLVSSKFATIEQNKQNKKSSDFDKLLSKKLPITAPSTTVQTISCNVAIALAKPKLSFVQIKKQSISNNPETSVQEYNACDMKSAGITLSSESVPGVTKIIELDKCTDAEPEWRFRGDEIHTSVEEIRAQVEAEELIMTERKANAKLKCLRFKSEISPSQNQNAEIELQREITKNAFSRMDIIGQFNLGFIIVKLDSDLFIVDQHATDEKYNFEILQSTTVLEMQPLAVPQPLEITAVNEMVLLDHTEVFQKNGFKFQIDLDAPPTKKVRLLNKPMSKNWEFGKEDIDELIFMLQDAPTGTVCRPSRIRAMFASRACRKSVMIGTALNKSTMRNLIAHMGEIEQPWNCPHGRPTMRHLVNTDMLLDNEDEEEKAEA